MTARRACSTSAAPARRPRCASPSPRRCRRRASCSRRRSTRRSVTSPPSAPTAPSPSTRALRSTATPPSARPHPCRWSASRRRRRTAAARRTTRRRPSRSAQKAKAAPAARAPSGKRAGVVDVPRAEASPSLRLAAVGGVDAASALLAPSRLSSILRTCWAFPARQRTYAWRFALQLPSNTAAHAALLAKGPHDVCARLSSALPLSNRRSLQRLERLLSCLSHWCPLFATVSELPPAVFPWLLAFDGDDLAAFEAAATVLTNWGLRLYEYHPHPPAEVLAEAHAVLAYCAPGVAAHLRAIGCGADAWAWPLLASFFARVLAKDDWLVLWDHLLCAQPRFVLFALAAFVAHHGALLLQASDAADVGAVLLRASALQMRLWLKTAYAFYDRWVADGGADGGVGGGRRRRRSRGGATSRRCRAAVCTRPARRCRARSWTTRRSRSRRSAAPRRRLRGSARSSRRRRRARARSGGARPSGRSARRRCARRRRSTGRSSARGGRRSSGRRRRWRSRSRSSGCAPRTRGRSGCGSRRRRARRSTRRDDGGAARAARGRRGGGGGAARGARASSSC